MKHGFEQAALESLERRILRAAPDSPDCTALVNEWVKIQIQAKKKAAPREKSGTT